MENKFEEILDEQIHRVAYGKCINDPEYKAANAEVGFLLEALKGILTTGEQRKLLSEVESALHLAEAIFLEYSYRQGIEDSQTIHKGLGAFGFSIPEPAYS